MDGQSAHRAIRELAVSQHGVVSRQQLLKLGIGVGLITHALKSGRLLPVFPGVYVVGRQADSYRTVWMAATLAAGPGAALAGVSAAAARGFMKPTNLIAIARAKGRRTSIKGASPGHHRFSAKIRTSRLLPEELTYVGSIATCSVPATLIQLAGTMNWYQFRRAFIEASRQGFLNETNLRHCLELGRTHKGMANLSKLIGLWHPESRKTKSILEGEFFFLCREHGIPTPRVNAWVGGKEVDCLWPDQRVIVELDSRTFHDDQFAFDRDRVRQNAAVVGGFQVLRFTYRMVTTEPRAVMSELAAVLKAPLKRE